MKNRTMPTAPQLARLRFSAAENEHDDRRHRLARSGPDALGDDSRARCGLHRCRSA